MESESERSASIGGKLGNSKGAAIRKLRLVGRVRRMRREARRLVEFGGNREVGRKPVPSRRSGAVFRYKGQTFVPQRGCQARRRRPVLQGYLIFSRNAFVYPGIKGGRPFFSPTFRCGLWRAPRHAPALTATLTIGQRFARNYPSKADRETRRPRRDNYPGIKNSEIFPPLTRFFSPSPLRSSPRKSAIPRIHGFSRYRGPLPSRVTA